MASAFLTIGRAYITESFHVPSMPPAGKITVGKANARYPDGSAVNTASALRKMGVNGYICTRVGEDDYGQALGRYLEAIGINTAYLKKDGKAQTGACCSIIENLGLHRKLLIEGANAKINEYDVERAFGCNPKYVIVNGDVSEECVSRALLMSVDCGAKVLLSLCSDFSVNIDLQSLCGVEVLVIDALNAKRRTGIAPYDVPTNLKICSDLSQQIRAEYYVLRCPDGSCFVYDGKYYIVVTTYDIEPLDDTASSEAFNVSMFLKYLLTGDMKHACEFGILSEVITAQKFGGAGTIPDLDAMKKFAKDNQLEEEITV